MRSDAQLTDQDREFARSFLALHFDLEVDPGKAGVELLCRILQQAREEGRQEECRRWQQMQSDAQPTKRDYEIAADACYSGKYACVGDRVADLIAAAREEGRQEERRRCAAVVASSRVTWDKDFIEAIVDLINTPSQEQSHETEVQEAPSSV